MNCDELLIYKKLVVR